MAEKERVTRQNHIQLMILMLDLEYAAEEIMLQALTRNNVQILENQSYTAKFYIEFKVHYRYFRYICILLTHLRFIHIRKE